MRSTLPKSEIFTEVEGHTFLALTCVTYLHVQGAKILEKLKVLQKESDESTGTDGTIIIYATLITRPRKLRTKLCVGEWSPAPSRYVQGISISY